MKIAVVQMDVKILDKQDNLGKILERLRTAARAGARIAVFPECALTGYCYESLEEARPLSEPVPGPSTEAIAAAARELGCTAIVGMLESAQGNIYNAAAVITPEGIAGTYRKIHLPYLGIDRFVAPGDRPFAVFTSPQGRIGVNICYDCSFPEAGRAVKLEGAQLLAIPTNWPVGSDSCQHIPIVRATENHMFVAAADRVGEERGFRFAGRSHIVDFMGAVKAQAGETEEVILYAEADLAAAEQNRVARIPGRWEFDRIADRRPEMYGALTRPAAEAPEGPREAFAGAPQRGGA
ncbi:MAG: carbon-nitrogen hydrolase family protein [Terriglobia bacterium]